jgi:hypothetical protein
MEAAAPCTISDERFVKNMRPLWRLDPRTALKIDAVRDEQRLRVERARSGDWTVRAADGDKSPVYLHSRHDPLQEAQQWAAAADLEDTFCVVVAGFGLGYHLAALHKRLRGDAFLICTEPDVRVVATALANVDLSELLASGKFLLFVDDDKQALHAKLQAFGSLMMLGMKFLRHPSCRVGGTGHELINRALTEFVTFTRMTLTTLMANSQITCRNVAMNLNHYVASASIDTLRDRFRGHPAMVISAGPSLSRNLELLSEWKGRAVLCAVQTAVRPLMS